MTESERLEYQSEVRKILPSAAVWDCLDRVLIDFQGKVTYGQLADIAELFQSERINIIQATKGSWHDSGCGDGSEPAQIEVYLNDY